MRTVSRSPSRSPHLHVRVPGHRVIDASRASSRSTGSTTSATSTPVSRMRFLPAGGARDHADVGTAQVELFRHELDHRLVGPVAGGRHGPPGASARRRSGPPLRCALHRVARGRRARCRPRKDFLLDGATSALLGVPEDLFDPTEPHDRGREPTGRDRQESDVPELGSRFARLQRLARVRPHRTLGERTHRECHLDESLRAGVQRTGLFSRPSTLVERLGDLRMGSHGRRGRSSADAVPWPPLKGMTRKESTPGTAPGFCNAELRSVSLRSAPLGQWRSARCRHVRDDAGVGGYLTTRPNAALNTSRRRAIMASLAPRTTGGHDE